MSKNNVIDDINKLLSKLPTWKSKKILEQMGKLWEESLDIEDFYIRLKMLIEE